MKEKPLVSIIIPTYNRAHLIGETLDSVLAQTYQNWECIVVDDGSTDNTDEVVNEYVEKDKRFKYYHRPDEHLPGGNGARNYGFKVSQGEYVNWFDSDDFMANFFLETRLSFVCKENSDMYIFFTSLMGKSNNGKMRIINLTYTGEKDVNNIVHRFLKFDIPWSTRCCLWKRKFLENKVIWDESLKIHQDWEMHIRLLIINKPTILFANTYPDTFIRYNVKDSISRDSQNLNKLKEIMASLLKVRYLITKQNNDSLLQAIDFSITRRLLRKLFLQREYTLLTDIFMKQNMLNIHYFKVIFIEFFSSFYLIRPICKKIFSNYYIKTESKTTYLKLYYEDIDGSFGDYMLL